MRRAVVLLVVASALPTWGVGVGAGSSPGMQLRVLRFVDRSRRAHFRNGTSGPRVLVTEPRYPTRGHAPYPLVVFAHGFTETPDVYARTLDTWARAGYVVAAPVFPVENPGAPGGPDESDLVNEPADLSFVISRLTARASVVRPLMRPPKFLLWLVGAAHLEPYTTNDRWARVVRSATTAFLDHYLRGAPLRPLIDAGTETGVARVASDP